MATDLVPAVRAALEVIPKTKKSNFDRAMEVAHLFLDNNTAIICGCINGLFQTYALMQENKERRKIVKYAYNYAEAQAKSVIEMKRLEVLEQRQWQQYDLQNRVLTLYVDQKFQQSVDELTRSFQSQWRKTEQDHYDFIKKIDNYTADAVEGMDIKYQEILRSEEVICAAYRDVLHEINAQGFSRNQVATEMFNQTVANLDKFNDDQFRILTDAIIKMTEPNFVPFEKFIEMKEQIRLGE